MQGWEASALGRSDQAECSRPSGQRRTDPPSEAVGRAHWPDGRAQASCVHGLRAGHICASGRRYPERCHEVAATPSLRAGFCPIPESTRPGLLSCIL